MSDFNVRNLLKKGYNLIFNLKKGVSPTSVGDLLCEVQRHYRLGPMFAGEYLKRAIGEDYNQQYTGVADLLAKQDPLHRMYIDFALSTNLRGSEAVRQLHPYLTEGHKKTIDIGCAYGGFVVAFSRAGYDAYGLEIDAGLAHFGKLNCADSGLSDNIRVGNILDVPLEELGTYDVITCNDVIEHVSDAGLTLTKLSALLNDHGVLNMLIPNKDAISFVESDGHFQLFGITLLERNDAKRYKFEMTGIADDYVHMGEYYPLAYYIDKFSSLKMQVHERSHHTIGDMHSVPDLLADLSAAYQRWFENDRGRISIALSEMIIDKYQKYLDKLNNDYIKATTSGDAAKFQTTYLSTFWDIVCVKNDT